MTVPLRPEDYMLTDELLLDIAGALGQAHARLVDESATSLGTLVVKTARLDIGFDFSAQAHKTTSGVGLRVRPTSGFGISAETTGDARQARAANRATVSLEIVNVAPLIEGAGPPPSAPGPPIAPAPPPVIAHKDVLAALNALHGEVKAAWPALEAGLAVALGQIVSRLNDQRGAEARALTAALLAELRQWLQSQNQVASVALGRAMLTLDAWVASPAPAPSPRESDARRKPTSDTKD